MAGHASSQPEIPGYTLGRREVPRAPITLAELELIKKSVLFTEEDAKYLRMSRTVLGPNVAELVGVWYGFVGANPHLLASFSSEAGEVDGAYLERVRARFERPVTAGRGNVGHTELAESGKLSRYHLEQMVRQCSDADTLRKLREAFATTDKAIGQVIEDQLAKTTVTADGTPVAHDVKRDPGDPRKGVRDA